MEAFGRRLWGATFIIVPGALIALFCSDEGEYPQPDAPLTRDEAMDLVLNLPEVAGFCRRIDARSDGTVRAVVFPDGGPSPRVWDFYVGESHATHTVRWNTFQVDGRTGEVRVAATDGDYLSLPAWRRR